VFVVRRRRHKRSGPLSLPRKASVSSTSVGDVSGGLAAVRNDSGARENRLRRRVVRRPHLFRDCLFCPSPLFPPAN
jgi:hypothetical protein